MKKTVAMLLSLVLAITCVVGATLAWMNDTTDKKTNTFTMGKVDIDLVEHEYDEDDTDTITDVEVVDECQYQMIPGTTYAKDPTVSVSADSEDCYLFVVVEEINDPAEYLDYELNLTGWTELEDGVYYRTVAKADTAREWNLLVDNKVSVKTTVENTEIEPQITFQAYAIQMANIEDAAAAWAELNA